jgi:hypothetical protein
MVVVVAQVVVAINQAGLVLEILQAQHLHRETMEQSVA